MQDPAPGVLIVDDHPLVADGMKLLVERYLALTCCVEGSVEAALARLARGERFALVMLDLELPTLSGLEGISRLLALDRELAIVVCSSHVGDAARHVALSRGARAYVGKAESTDRLLATLRRVLRDGSRVVPAPAPASAEGLTARQREVLWLMADGKSNKVIALRLALSENTVRNHVAAILERLGVENRTEAAAAARRLGLGSAPA